MILQDTYRPHPSDHHFQYYGFNIITSLHLTMEGEPVTKIRSWRERLFSLPWQPFLKKVVTIPMIPADHAILLHNKHIVIHPEMFEKLKEAIDDSREPRIRFRPEFGTVLKSPNYFVGIDFGA